MYIPSKERARVIKKALASVFGARNVSVRKGTGTASSWVEASVKCDRPEACTCEWKDTYWNGRKAEKPYRSSTYCPACKEQYEKVNELAEKTEKEAMKSAGYEHSTYYSDDGYGTECDEFILSITVL